MCSTSDKSVRLHRGRHRDKTERVAKMEQIKKKMTALREEHNLAMERAEDAEFKLKEIQSQLDAVSDL